MKYQDIHIAVSPEAIDEVLETAVKSKCPHGGKVFENEGCRFGHPGCECEDDLWARSGVRDGCFIGIGKEKRR